MKIRKWTIIILGAIFCGLMEGTFLTLLPSPWREVRPILEVAILLIVINRPREAVVFSTLAGFILDTFSVGTSTFAMSRLPIVIGIILLIAQSWFTNRSVYAAAALVLGARLLDRLWLWAAYIFGTHVFTWNVRLEPTASFVTTLIWDSILVSLMFVGLALFTRRFLVTIPRVFREYDES